MASAKKLTVSSQHHHHVDIATQDQFDYTAMTLIDDPEGTTIERLVLDIVANSVVKHNAPHTHHASAMSTWIAPSPVSVKMRLFCFPYAGGISENVFARQAPRSVRNACMGLERFLRKLLAQRAFRLTISLLNCRWAMMMPPSIQVCPIEIPGRGRREQESPISNVADLAQALAHGLPLQARLRSTLLWSHRLY